MAVVGTGTSVVGTATVSSVVEVEVAVGTFTVVTDVVVAGGRLVVLGSDEVSPVSGLVGIAVVVRVRTSTPSKRGLDHIRMCEPFSDFRVFAIRVEW